MERITANQILDNINRAMDKQRTGQETVYDIEASRCDLAEAGYPTKLSAYSGRYVPVITHGLKWGEPDNA